MTAANFGLSLKRQLTTFYIVQQYILNAVMVNVIASPPFHKRIIKISALPFSLLGSDKQIDFRFKQLTTTFNLENRNIIVQ